MAKGKTIAKLADLTQDSRNANKGTQRGRAALENSLGRYGAGRSILADREGRIIAGNKTAEEAAERGMEIIPVHTTGNELVVVIRDDLDLDGDPRARALAFADNRVAELDLAWDPDAIQAAIGDNIDLSDLFTDDELGDMIAQLDDDGGARAVANAGNGDPDALPNVPEVPISRLGDRWLLGIHRLVVGDATDPVALTRLFAGQQAGGLMTAPPAVPKKPADWLDLLNRACAVALPFLEQDAQLFFVLGLVHREGAVVRYWEPWLDAMQTRGIPLLGWYVWDKLVAPPGDREGRLAPAHEFVYHFALDSRPPEKVAAKTAGNGKADGPRRNRDGTLRTQMGQKSGNDPFTVPDSVIRVAAPDPDSLPRGLPAPSPVGLPQLFVDAWPALVWFDPFGGTGTTLIAAEIAGRSCYTMELVPAYADVILERWADFTGEDPEREDGASWRDLFADARG